jgi:hypothetical protein
MIPRKHVRVDVPDKSAELPDGLPAGTRVRLAPTRTTGTVVRAEEDRGGTYVVVKLDSTGGLRCITPDRLTPVQKRRRRRKVAAP